MFYNLLSKCPNISGGGGADTWCKPKGVQGLGALPSITAEELPGKPCAPRCIGQTLPGHQTAHRSMHAAMELDLAMEGSSHGTERRA
eukprot:1147683-Pelagomonas_calceolata.AAC.4